MKTPDRLIYEHRDTVFTREAISFVIDLVKKFSPQIQNVLYARKQQQSLFDAGVLPNFLTQTKHIRDSEWKVAPIPADLLDRRVEITGPVERKMIINALNSGANVFMADFEDSNSPTWDNVIQGQINLMDAVRRTISFTNEAGKEYKLNAKTAVLMVRPRGWHLIEKHFEVDGKPAPASLFDFGFYFFHNAKELMAHGTAPYFYLPKIETHKEARLWNDVFKYAQKKLDIPVGTIRATVLIETITAAFEIDEILWELREHSSGANMGRYDYIFSFIKKFANNPNFILPDRSQITMDKAFLNAYCKLLIQTCNKRGIHAIGGMAAQIPIKNDPIANEKALEKVRIDKLREVKLGASGAWVAHPGLVSVVRDIFDQNMKGFNQINRQFDYVITQEQLLEVHQGTRTEDGLRYNIRICIIYLESWFRGVGCVPIYNLMEDLATANLSFAQIWQWLHNKVSVDGTILDLPRFQKIAAEELIQVEKEVGERFTTGKFQKAYNLFMEVSTSPFFVQFLTTVGYDLLE
jgi:malate synthase